MKTKNKSIDIIGGLGPLTKEEENAISAFLKKEIRHERELPEKRVAKVRSKIRPSNPTLGQYVVR